MNINRDRRLYIYNCQQPSSILRRSSSQLISRCQGSSHFPVQYMPEARAGENHTNVLRSGAARSYPP